MMVSLVAITAAPSFSRAQSNDSAVTEPQKKKKRSIFTSLKESGGTSTRKTSNANAHAQGSGGKATTQTAVLNDGSVAPFITPDSTAAIQAMADKYAGIAANGGWPRLPKGNLNKGAEGKNASILNQRLVIEGYLSADAVAGANAQIFGSATEAALMQFQRNHGLAVTGKVDGATLFALNVPAERRLATIRANIPRLAEYSKDLGGRYIVVNIPAQQIETVSEGKVYSLHNAIVGRPSRPTPVVMTPLTIVRFNPYWNAPASIVEKDILPRMLSKGPSKIMREMNMKVFDGVGGPEIDPDDVNWRRVRVDDYHFRQEPGGSNAMATAKIEFNSPFGIYLHDTPEPHLFNTGARFYSSGCVRVDGVAVMIDWIMQGQDGLNSTRIAELAETKERLDTTITTPPQLRVAYLTAWPA
ncbi:MAG: L,D-transpeptidase family protein, partial [Aestuariivirga sp.]|nr:L,D-transpeptidase family protein [Aestuariivirga sp.]